MKIIELPQDAEKREKKSAALTRNRKAFGIFSFAFAIVAILGLIGAIVCIVLTEVGERSEDVKTLLYILVGAFVGGAVVFALLAFLVSKLSQCAYLTELDYRERCDSDYSFFVGDGTLATFEETRIRLHMEKGGREDVYIPYSEMRFFSVCARRAPREKGEWSVVMEIPMKYLSQKGEAAKSEQPALVQTDAKERLTRVLEERGLSLIGERESAGSKEKFTLLRKFIFPDATARRRSLMLLALGIVFLGAGIGIAFWMLTAGAVLSAAGLFLTGRAIYSFVSAKRVLAFYREGVYWREKTKVDSVFLKWEEIKNLTVVEKDGVSLLKAECDYGAYHFLNTEGVLEYAEEVRK